MGSVVTLLPCVLLWEMPKGAKRRIKVLYASQQSKSPLISRLCRVNAGTERVKGGSLVLIGLWTVNPLTSNSRDTERVSTPHLQNMCATRRWIIRRKKFRNTFRLHNTSWKWTQAVHSTESSPLNTSASNKPFTLLTTKSTKQHKQLMISRHSQAYRKIFSTGGLP